MKSLQTYSRYNKITLVVLALVVCGIFTYSPIVLAAPPGCYTFNTTSGVYASASCNDAELTRAVNQSGRCFLSTMNPGGNRTAFADTPCANIIVAATPAPSTSGIDPVVPVDSTVNPSNPSITQGDYTCGSGTKEVRVAFSFGCRGSSYNGELNPIVDIAFAIFRGLSAGVGMVIIGSIIVAGMQYSTSRGNPQATQASINRITNSITALLLFMFMFVLANFLVPGGLFN